MQRQLEVKDPEDCLREQERSSGDRLMTESSSVHMQDETTRRHGKHRLVTPLRVHLPGISGYATLSHSARSSRSLKVDSAHTVTTLCPGLRQSRSIGSGQRSIRGCPKPSVLCFGDAAAGYHEMAGSAYSVSQDRELYLSIRY